MFLISVFQEKLGKLSYGWFSLVFTPKLNKKKHYHITLTKFLIIKLFLNFQFLKFETPEFYNCKLYSVESFGNLRIISPSE
jgi:hypothetical protein